MMTATEEPGEGKYRIAIFFRLNGLIYLPYHKDDY